MDYKKILINEIEDSSDEFLIEELLDFFLFLKNRKKTIIKIFAPTDYVKGNLLLLLISMSLYQMILSNNLNNENFIRYSYFFMVYYC